MVGSYSERLQRAMQEAKPHAYDVAGLARALKISYQAVKKAVDGGKFGTENNIKAAALLMVRNEWLATGEGAMRASTEQAPSPAGHPVAPGERFDNLSEDEKRILHNLREIQVDDDQYKELIELISLKAAKMRALRERLLAPYGIRSMPERTSADERHTQVARAALRVTDNLRQRSLFEHAPVPPK